MRRTAPPTDVPTRMKRDVQRVVQSKEKKPINEKKASSNADDKENRIPIAVAGFTLGRRLGSGCYGDVYIGHRCGTNEEVAIKLEPVSSKRRDLKREWDFYGRLEGGRGVPKVYWYGTVGDYNALVMELLGPSIRDLWKQCGHRFSLRTVLSLADQIIEILQFVHSKGIVHQDLKSQNLCFGRGANAGQVYILDFGLSKNYIDQRQRHIPHRQGDGFVGSPAFSSINSHFGSELSRRDDMESLAYVLIQLLHGVLPWQKNIPADRVKQAMATAKLSTPVGHLCVGLPVEFSEYINICRNLGFTEEPPYDGLRKLMQNALAQENSIGKKPDCSNNGASSDSTDYSPRVIDEFEQQEEEPTSPKSVYEL